MSAAYYNEHDPKAVAWLRELIKNGHIAPGEVDERDIRDVTANDLRGFTQHHFFAGIGVWSYALRLAGWPDDRPVWTGSCPCQPFSAAGKRSGVTDDRHLWPAFHWLIRQYRPDVVFGEQVASKDGVAWLDIVSSDLEGEGYAVGPVVLPACGVGAPHIRQRLWFVADSPSGGRGEFGSETSEGDVRYADGGNDSPSRMAHTDGGNSRAEREQRGREQRQLEEDGKSRILADSQGGRLPGRSGAGRSGGSEVRDGRELGESEQFGRGAGRFDQSSGSNNASREEVERERDPGTTQRPGTTNGFWSDAEWIYCRDEKLRAIEPSSFPLVNGAPARVGRLRGYGNAIVAQAAAKVIGAYLG